MAYWQQQGGDQSYWNAGSGGAYDGSSMPMSMGMGYGGMPDYGGGEAAPMEIQVEAGYVGRIIGKGGSKIRELEETTGCRIKVQGDRSNGVTTPVELTGTQNAQMHAKQLIDELCAQDFNRGGFGGGRGGGGGYGGYDGYGPPVEIQVDCSNVGRIIGRGGSKIRELEEETGCRIKVFSDRSNGTTTPIELRGNADAQQRAKTMIEEFCQSFPQY